MSLIKDFCVSCWFLYAQLVSLLSIGYHNLSSHRTLQVSLAYLFVVSLLSIFCCASCFYPFAAFFFQRGERRILSMVSRRLTIMQAVKIEDKGHKMRLIVSLHPVGVKETMITQRVIILCFFCFYYVKTTTSMQALLKSKIRATKCA